jgi:hypothetical protein
MIERTPKLFYTPAEIDAITSYKDLKCINLSFKRFMDLNDNLNSFSIVNIKYIKIELRNTEYDYVYVMEDCVGVFLDLYDLIK